MPHISYTHQRGRILEIDVLIAGNIFGEGDEEDDASITEKPKLLHHSFEKAKWL